MAIDKKALKTRSLTAVVFVVVMLAGLLINFWSFFILFSVIHFGCWLEYLKLVEKINAVKIDTVIKYFFAICGFTLLIISGFQHNAFDIGKEVGGFRISFKILLWLILFAGLVLLSIQNKQIPSKAKWMCFGGLLYISLSLGMLTNVRDNFFIENGNSLTDTGKVYVCGIIFSIWINDTMAYLVGSLIGKTPFSKISPKKTWEGTGGGAILCVLVIALLGIYVPPAKVLNVKHWMAIAGICAIFGTLGDLLESKLKRLAGVKDSGSIMPGHGGFLDRFDSLLVASPFVWLYIKLFV